MITSTRKSSEQAIDFAQGTAPSIWHNSAPGRVRKAQKNGDAKQVWSAWSAYLAKRKITRSVEKLVATKSSPLLWAIDRSCNKKAVQKLLKQLAVKKGKTDQQTVKSLEKEASSWMADAVVAGSDTTYALHAVAWAAALPSLAGVLSSKLWWNLVGHLTTAALEAAEEPIEPSPLAHQLVAGELAQMLACSLPELVPCRKLAKNGRKAIESGLETLLDGEGLPQADHLLLLRPLLACWIRCQMLDLPGKPSKLGTEAASQLEWAVRQALRWTREDGSPIFSPADSEDTFPANLFDAAMALDEDEEDRHIATLVLPGRKKSEREKASRFRLPEASMSSTWSAAAMLRPDWSHTEPRFSVLYPDRTVQTELSVRRELLWSGPWQCEVHLDGKCLSPIGDWEESCWMSDEEADYLELTLELTDNVRIERQIVMTREDGFMLLADAVLGERTGRLDYRGCLPLSSDISTTEMDETREILLDGRRRTATVLPLALPEWRSDQRVGTIERTEAGLELRQQADAHSMYCPLFFDFETRRAKRARTWRQLTVAASLDVQPADVAVGYRVQMGSEQWIIYRSLVERANRTLLGHNLSSETLVARFDEAGEVEALVEAE